MKLGDRLVQLRKERHYTRDEFAQLLGISKYTLRNYELGITEPGHPFLIKIAGMFDTSIDYILGLTEEREKMHSYELKTSEFERVEKYRSLDSLGQSHVDTVLDWEVERTAQAKGTADTIPICSIPSRFFAYYGRIDAAGTSMEFSDLAAGVKAYPENEINKNADYVIGVSGNSMEPEYFNGDIVYVQKTGHIESGDIGIFQKGNNIYIKKADENGLVSLNPNYPPLTADGDRITVLGKVLGQAKRD